jgi:hypothetical protein
MELLLLGPWAGARQRRRPDLRVVWEREPNAACQQRNDKLIQRDALLGCSFRELVV